MSRRPNSRSAASNRALTWPRSVTSAGQPMTLPSDFISAAARAVESAERPQIATETPSRSRCSAMARPIPRVPPVTIALLPFSDSIAGFYAGCAGSRSGVVRITTGMGTSNAQTSALRRLFNDRVEQLATEAEGLLTEGRERARRDFAEQVNQSARRMRQAADAE